MSRSESPRDFEIVSKEEVESSQKKDMESKGGGPVQVRKNVDSSIRYLRSGYHI